jgi:hypothetical protein
MKIGDKIGTVASSIANGFESAFSGLDFGNILRTINTGLFAALVFGVREFMSKLIGAFSGKDSGPRLLDTIKETFGGLTDTSEDHAADAQGDNASRDRHRNRHLDSVGHWHCQRSMQGSYQGSDGPPRWA